MELLTEECNERHIQQDVQKQRLQLACKQIEALQNDKLAASEYKKFEAMTNMELKSMNSRFEQMENTVRETIDYVVRYQWRETRNIVNKAMSKVIRPLQLKDLFYVNVGGQEHEVFMTDAQKAERERLRQEAEEALRAAKEAELALLLKTEEDEKAAKAKSSSGGSSSSGSHTGTVSKQGS